MKGMLSSLDPHSQFMDPDDFKDMQDDTRSRFNGLGVEVAVKDGLLTVVTPMEDTPAAKAGILAGDQILKINGASTETARICRTRSRSSAASPDRKSRLRSCGPRPRRSKITRSSARKSKCRA